MAICSPLNGNIVKSCLNNTAGVKKIFIADFENVELVTLAGTPETVSAIDMATGSRFYDFAFNRNTSNIAENTAIDLTNGSTFFNQTVTLVLHRREAIKRDAIEKLTAGQKQLMVIVLDNNDNYWLVGRAEGAYTTNVESGSGTNKNDMNGYTITITAEDPKQAYTIDAAVIPALLIPAV